jgi:hypothetical protein
MINYQVSRFSTFTNTGYLFILLYLLLLRKNQVNFMSQINVYIQLWEYLREKGLKTIEVIENGDAWEYKVTPKEFSVKETFYHTLRSIFEDAGNWFLNDKSSFVPSDNPAEDLNISIDRMISAIKNFTDAKLKESFTFQWGEKTTIEGAITQNLFHAVEHFSQLRHREGIHKRNK